MRERERTCYSHLRTKKCLVIFSYTIIKTLWNRHLETTFVKMHQVLTWAHRITKTFLHSFILFLSVCLLYFGQRCSHKSLPLTFPREAPRISGIAERGKRGRCLLPTSVENYIQYGGSKTLEKWITMEVAGLSPQVMTDIGTSADHFAKTGLRHRIMRITPWPGMLRHSYFKPLVWHSSPISA